MHRIVIFCLCFSFLSLAAFAEPVVIHKPPLVGIGVNLRFNATGKEICITEIVPGSPAASAGIALNTRVTRIDDVSTDGLSVGECVTKIRGPEGTKVKLELMDSGTGQRRTVEFVRQPLHLQK